MRLDYPMLVINGVELPPVSHDKYSAALLPLEKVSTAIDGTMISEWIGRRRQINYQIDYLGNQKMRELLAALRGGKVLTVQFLPDEDDYPQTGSFLCTKRPNPQAAFARNGVLLWHDISFTLESVRVV